MTTVLDDNIHNVRVAGTFDDCQSHVKALFQDADFRAKHSLGAVNSINWARILAQIVCVRGVLGAGCLAFAAAS